jgi:hypothetical protein
VQSIVLSVRVLLHLHTWGVLSTSGAGDVAPPLAFAARAPLPWWRAVPRGVLREPVVALPRSCMSGRYCPVPYWRPVLPALPACFLPYCRSDRFGRSVSGLSREDSWALGPVRTPPTHRFVWHPTTPVLRLRGVLARVCTLTFAGGAGSLLTLGLRRIPDPRASVSPRSQSPPTPRAVRRAKFVCPAVLLKLQYHSRFELCKLRFARHSLCR